MYPFGRKSLAEVTAEDILSLEDEENQYLDYKLDLSPGPGGKAFDKLELRKDVTSFANADGGVLIVGVADDGKTKKPTSHRPGVSHFKGKTPERIEQELCNALDVWIYPRLPNYQVRAIPVPGQPDMHYCVIAVHGLSWRAPHFYREDGSKAHLYFYMRHGADNKPMEHEEMVESFTRTQAQRERVSDFREYLLNLHDFSGENREALILHFFPLGFEEESRKLDLKPVKRNSNELRKLGFKNWRFYEPTCSTHYDFDGINATFESSVQRGSGLGSVKILRNGALELVDYALSAEGRMTPNNICFEINFAVHQGWDLMTSLGLQPPFDVGFTAWRPEISSGPMPIRSVEKKIFPFIRVDQRDCIAEDLYHLLEHVAQSRGISEPTTEVIQTVQPGPPFLWPS